MKIENKILLSRLMTRSGDQAWDFAVPLVLIELFSSNLRIAFVYFFAIKFGSMVLMPYAGKFIDRHTRKKSIFLGIGLQALAVLASAVIIQLLKSEVDYLLFSTLLFLGLLSAIGTNVMDIAVANDLVPSALTKDQLPSFNSRLRQLDLLTEVTSPIIAGALLLISTPSIQLLGFYLIVAWNLISFYPEYFLLNRIIQEHPELNSKKIVPQNVKLGIIQKLKAGWKDFIGQSIAPVIIAYALLWISVLSPHGVLLTAFLKGGWHLSEPVIGVFRAGGAIFGLAATFIYPRLHKKFGLVITGNAFISFQASMVLLAAVVFHFQSVSAQYAFLAFILFSRIGLYGFGLSETELRQILIPENMRGEVNGVATSLTSLATLLIFGFGIWLSEVAKFQYLVFISCFAVICASLIFNSISRRSMS